MKRTTEELKNLYIGKKIGKLTITSHQYTNRRSMWTCLCDCGVEFVSRIEAIESGKTKSCGCLNKARMTKHGHFGSRTYNSWCSMIRRCTIETNKDYYNYGARGITVCQEWRDDFRSFLSDMGERPENTSLDRIDSNGHYCKDNCRWSDKYTQARNRRTVKKNNVGKTPKMV